MKLAIPAPHPAVPTVSSVDGTFDDGLVAGLRLPRIPGLPGPMTPGTRDLLGPPAPGSRLDIADMAAVKGAQQLRTPEGDAWAVKMAKEGVASLWFDLADRQRSVTGSLPAWLDKALIASTLATTATLAAVAKHRFQRRRPFQTDPTIRPPFKAPHGTSYPSGHASAAFAAARVISRLEPSLAAKAYALATQVAVSRVYAGVHYPSDVLAGAMFGTAIGESVLRVV